MITLFYRWQNWDLDRLHNSVKVTMGYHKPDTWVVQKILLFAMLNSLAGKVNKFLFSVLNLPINITGAERISKTMKITFYQETLTLTLFLVSSPVMNLPKLLRNRSAELSYNQQKPPQLWLFSQRRGLTNCRSGIWGQQDNPGKSNVTATLLTETELLPMNQQLPKTKRS